MLRKYNLGNQTGVFITKIGATGSYRDNFYIGKLSKWYDGV